MAAATAVAGRFATPADLGLTDGAVRSRHRDARCHSTASDVDTDQIIPSDWLKRIERTGFGAGLFAEWRDDPEFVLNQPEYAGATILVAGPELRQRLVPRARRLGAGGLRLPAS